MTKMPTWPGALRLARKSDAATARRKSAAKLACAALLSAAFCGPALAAGQYDGIYQLGSSDVYLSVHQNGGVLVATKYTNVASSGVTTALASVQAYPMPSLAVWELLSGSISGASAQVSGTTVYQACTQTVNIAFSNTTATLTWSKLANTAIGTNQNVNCATEFTGQGIGIGSAVSFTKIF